jgi:hypothetical protein
MMSMASCQNVSLVERLRLLYCTFLSFTRDASRLPFCFATRLSVPVRTGQRYSSSALSSTGICRTCSCELKRLVANARPSFSIVLVKRDGGHDGTMSSPFATASDLLLLALLPEVIPDHTIISTIRCSQDEWVCKVTRIAERDLSPLRCVERAE